MGTIYVTSYANIFMDKFESAHIYPYIRDKTTTYLQYWEDFFFIWKGTEEELISFIEDFTTKNTLLLNSVLNTQKQRVFRH